METNNKNINHLFYSLPKKYKTNVVFTTSDDITTEQVKSALKEFDCYLEGDCVSSKLRFDRVITDEELETLININNGLGKKVITYDFAKLQKNMDEILKVGKEQNGKSKILN